MLLRRLFYTACLLGLLVIAAALFTAAAPRLAGFPTLVVSGGSMGESAENGSLIIARWKAAEEVRVGDVIVLQQSTDSGPAQPRLHRVISLDREGGDTLVVTMGDANTTPDPGILILPDRVQTPAYTVPHAGYIVGFVKTPTGWALLAALPALVAALFIVRGIWAKVPAEAGGPRRVK
jgi:signal peptidase I